jgi:hypothetical protein
MVGEWQRSLVLLGESSAISTINTNTFILAGGFTGN